MPTMTRDQIRHEVINLQKTLKLLERSVEEEDWTRCTSKDRNNKWLKTQSILSGVNHCRSVLRNVTPSDYDFGLGDRRSVSGQQFHEDAKLLLDRLEREMIEIDQDLKPRPRRSKLILPTLPRPSPISEKAHFVQDERPRHSVDETLIPVDESEMKGQIDLPPTELFIEPQTSPEDETNPPNTMPNRLANPASTLLPPSLPSSSALSGEGTRTSGAVPGFLQTSTALHEDLSSQLAQMATQLRRNAEQFSEALTKDEGVVKATQERLEQNYDVVTKERVRLRDHSGKSRSTTCLVFLSILIVVIGFFMTFFVIRIT